MDKANGFYSQNLNNINMKVDINTQKTPQFISVPLIAIFIVPIVVTLYKAIELWFF